MPLQDLSSTDRQHFLSRLARYGIDEQQLRDEALVVRRDTHLKLSHRTTGELSPHLLKTTDLDVVREWIGLPEPVRRARYEAHMPDEVNFLARRPMRPSFRLEDVRRRAVRQPSAARASTVAGREAAALRGFDRRVLRREELDELRTAARTYIRGDQELVAEYKPILEAFYGEFQIAGWFFTTVVVESGAVLELGPGANVLSAYEVVIHQGGTIRSQGTLTVDCTVLSAPTTPTIRPEITGPMVVGSAMPIPR